MNRSIACAKPSCALVFALVGLAGAVASAQPAYHDVIAKTGSTVPGAPDVTMNYFWDQVHQSPTGKKLFFGTFLQGAGVTPDNNMAMFAGSPDSPEKVFRTGVQAPGCPGGVLLGSFYSAGLADSGVMSFIGVLEGAGITSNVNDLAIYTGTPSSFSLVLRDGQAAPQLPGLTVSRIGHLEVSGGNRLSFGSLLAGAGVVTDVNDRAFYYGLPNALQIVARTGDQAAGLAQGVKYGWLHNWHTQSESGKLGFVMNLTGAGVNTSNNQAAYVGTPGNLAMILRTGTQAAGQAQGVVYSEIVFANGINNNGYITMSGRLAGPGVTAANDTVMMASSGSGVKVIAREGSQAPGLAGGVLIGSMEYGESYANIGGSNLIMMKAGLTGPGVTVDSDRAIWVGFAGGSFQLLAREGGQVPGELAGVVWSELTYTRVTANSAGQVAFQGRAKNVNTGEDLYSIYLRETDGQLRPIVKTGDTLMVGSDDYRIVKTVALGSDNGGQCGGKTVLTDSGLILGTVRFTDNSTAVVRFDSARVCPADFDSSGFVDKDDFDAFVAAFEAGSQSADFDKSGFVDTDDFDAYVKAFEIGC